MNHWASNALFRFCPQCGKPKPVAKENAIQCRACDFQFYRNPAVAVAAIFVAPNGNILLLRRARDPEKGKWALPGGFIDAGETAEQALRRECREEVGLRPGSMEFLCSEVNHYTYRKVLYPLVDLFFVCRTRTRPRLVDPGEVSELQWVEKIPWTEIAFVSIHRALKAYKAREKRPQRIARLTTATLR